LVILDDGFQHWKIHKDVEVLALTSSIPGQRVFRDSLNAIKKANLLVWTKGASHPETFGKPKVRVTYGLIGNKPPNSERYWLVTGVAEPDSVFSTAVAAGYNIVRKISFQDHANYDHKTVGSLLNQAKCEGCRIAITGKDWVKWRELGVREGEIQVLKLNLVFEKEGRELWSKVLWGHSA
jgi:tetraacyldisaccharide 4'-kinase